MKTRTIISNQQQPGTEGFTVIELIVTMVVMSVFFFGLFQASILLDSQRVAVARRARASDIAYSNLKEVPTRPTQITASVCSTNAAVMDMTTSGNKTGLDITQYGYTVQPSADVTKALGNGATQTLVAYAPDGCSNLATNPIEIVSTVTFGGDKVTHAAYVQ